MKKSEAISKFNNWINASVKTDEFNSLSELEQAEKAIQWLADNNIMVPPAVPHSSGIFINEWESEDKK